jgi:hypothetical protein
VRKLFFFLTVLSIIMFFPGAVRGREVLSWVPPYSISACYTMLNSNFGTFSPKNVLTALALQFWRPTDVGGLVYEIKCHDTIVAKFRTKCTEYGIKLLLTVYNNNQQNLKWDWNLARKAFRTNKSNFVKSLVDECKRLNLDGVDIDLEGLGEFDADRAAFADFIKELGALLHAAKLLLTVDSFHSPCYNAPNMAWWEDWVGYVDYIHSMGYEQLYENNNSTLDSCPSELVEMGKKFFKYSYQSQYGLKKGLSKTVVSIGMPSTNTWGGGYVRDHIKEILNLPSPTGICIWDFTLTGAQWKESETWQLAQQLVDLDTGLTAISGTIPVWGILPISAIYSARDRIGLSVLKRGDYALSLYDLSGRLLCPVLQRTFEKGIRTVAIPSHKLVNGICIVTIKGEEGFVARQVLYYKRVIF